MTIDAVREAIRDAQSLVGLTILTISLEKDLWELIVASERPPEDPLVPFFRHSGQFPLKLQGGQSIQVIRRDPS